MRDKVSYSRAHTTFKSGEKSAMREYGSSFFSTIIISHVAS